MNYLSYGSFWTIWLLKYWKDYHIRVFETNRNLKTVLRLSFDYVIVKTVCRTKLVTLDYKVIMQKVDKIC